jgi:hypothetical protein
LNGERKLAEKDVERAMQLAHNDALLFAEAGWLFYEMAKQSEALPLRHQSILGSSSSIPL